MLSDQTSTSTFVQFQVDLSLAQAQPKPKPIAEVNSAKFWLKLDNLRLTY